MTETLVETPVETPETPVETSLDELVRLWGPNVRPVLVADPEWTNNNVLDFGLTKAETHFRFFEYYADDGIPHSIGLFTEQPGSEDTRESLDELVGVWGARVRPVFSDPDSIVAEDILNFGQTSKTQVRHFEHVGADGTVHRVGLLVGSEADISTDVTNKISSFDVCLDFGTEDLEGLESTITDMLEFSRTSTDDKELKFFKRTDGNEFYHRLGLLGKDVRQGSLVVKLLGNNWTPLIHRVTASCLANLADTHDIRIQIASWPGVLQSLLSLLQEKYSADPEVLEQTARCLGQLALAVTENQLRIASHPGMLDCLVSLLLEAECVPVLEQTAKCLTHLAESRQNQVKITSHPGALDALVRLSGRSRNSGVSTEAVTCLTSLTIPQENREIIVSHPGILSALLSLLGDKETAQMQLSSLKCLNNLANDYPKNKVVLASHRLLLDTLVRIMKLNWGTSGRVRVQELAVRCLLYLASAYQNLVKIASHPGTLDALVKCLGKFTFHRVQNLAAECLSELAAEPENQGKIITHRGALAAIVRMLAQEVNPTGQEWAAKCLSKLANAKEAKIIIASGRGVLEALVSLVQAGPGSLALEPTIKCMASLALWTDKQAEIASHPGALDALVKLLGQDVDRSKGCNNLEGSQCNPEPKYLDHLTCELMCDPVICSDGRTYDRWTVIDRSTLYRRPNHSLQRIASYEIFTDDINVRKGLFDSFPEQREKSSNLRRRYREEALQNGLLGKYEDAKEKLTNVLKWAPSDVECRTELERILNVLLQSNDPERWDMDPITYERICDPVKCSDGRTYDRWTIIDHNLVKCPYDSNLKSFAILVDDLNVRRRLFETFPDQETSFRLRRARYREGALQLAQKLLEPAPDQEACFRSRRASYREENGAKEGEVKEAIRKLSNVLKWAPTDKICRKELSRIRQEFFKIPVLNHEDLVRKVKEEQMDQLALPTVVLLFAAAVWFLLESGFMSVQFQF